MMKASAASIPVFVSRAEKAGGRHPIISATRTFELADA